MVSAQFVIADTGCVFATAFGKDWEQALDRLYSKVMKIEPRPVLHIRFDFNANSSQTR